MDPARRNARTGRDRPSVVRAIAAAAASAPLLASCAASVNAPAPAREIDLGAFSAVVDPSAPTESGEPRVEPRRVALHAAGPASAGGGVDWKPLPPDDAPRARGRRVEAGERIIIDGMVGQVNGYPIFADAFFEPIEDSLIALRTQVPKPEAYPAAAAKIVGAELQQVVLNALFLAEAESDLSVEEQRGIQAWVQDLATRVISGHEGSEELARRAIFEEQGKSFETHLQDLRDQALIQRLLQERIAPRIIVSWRDIEREYRRRIDEFEPSPRITIARIRLATNNTTEIDEVTLRLRDGETLAEIADANGQGGGAAWQTFEVADGDLANIDLANEEIKARLAGLHQEGDIAGPFEVGRTTWWLGIAAIEQEPRRDLYDDLLQRQLAAQIRQARGSEEQERYISSLLDKGIYDELEEMVQRLLIVALHRYGP